MSNSNHNKKAKKDEQQQDWQSEFEAVRQFLESSPFAPGPAVAAALNGIDQEVKRRLRDSKLQQKFATSSATTSNTTTTTNSLVMDSCDADAVKVEKPAASTTERRAATNAMMTDDWHDIADDGDAVMKQQQQSEDANSSTSCYLGQVLAKKAVAAIAQHNVKCSSPIAALAAVLHGALLSAGFSCTGLPDDENGSSSGGFAAPIRKLPVSQFLPANWENKNKNGQDKAIKLRYRNEATGATVLTVTPVATDSGGAVDQQEVQVTLAAPGSNEPCRDPLQFALQDHINLESWTRAARDNGSVSPALHYKALSALLTSFAQHFDLGPVDEGFSNNNSEASSLQATPYVDYTMQQTRPQVDTNSNNNAPSFVNYGFPRRPQSQDDPSRLMDPNRLVAPPTRPGGDFSGDLTPSGIAPFVPGNPGNLMGPNHPMLGGSGGSARFGYPRIDPFGPPGPGTGEPSPTEPQDPDNLLDPTNTNNRQNNKPQRGGTGRPNNDQLRPPSLPENNMFM